MAGATPRQRRHLRSRANILAAARELVLERGAENLSLREVAARAGYSPASLYEYFESKEDLVGALAAGILERLRVRLAAVPDALAPRKRLVRLGEAYLAFARENPADYLLVFSRLPSSRRSTAERIPPASPFASVHAAVQAGIDGGEIDACAPAEEIAYGLWALVHGMATLQLTHLAGFHADFESADRRALAAHVAGLGRKR